MEVDIRLEWCRQTLGAPTASTQDDGDAWRKVSKTSCVQNAHLREKGGWARRRHVRPRHPQRRSGHVWHGPPSRVDGDGTARCAAPGFWTCGVPTETWKPADAWQRSHRHVQDVDSAAIEERPSKRATSEELLRMPQLALLWGRETFLKPTRLEGSRSAESAPGLHAAE